MRVPIATTIRTALALSSAMLALCAVAARAEERREASESVVPISASLCSDMKARHVLNAGAPVDCSRLRLVKFVYHGFDGKPHADGEIVVMDAAADHVRQIFEALHQRGFPLQRAKLMNEYDGDDDASMEDDNTSSFNVRPVAGSSSISVHAYGLAIDLNPVQNPFLQRSGGKLAVSPRGGRAYVDRSNVRPGMAESIVDVFAAHGFVVWGGEWRNPIDYQHFQVSRRLAGALARASAADAERMFERYVERYRSCMRSRAGKRQACAKANG
jgi:D-alanyl-D-alanine carboxypeptidase-like protein